MNKRKLPGLEGLQTGPSTIEGISHELFLEFDVPAGELNRRCAACRVARSVFMEMCCLYLTRKMSLGEIGRRPGDLSVWTLSQNKKRMAAKMRDDYHLRQRFYKLTGLKI